MLVTACICRGRLLCPGRVAGPYVQVLYRIRHKQNELIFLVGKGNPGTHLVGANSLSLNLCLRENALHVGEPGATTA